MTPSALRALRAVALFVVAASVAGSLISMVRVGRNAPVFLLILFAAWILAPFAVVPVASLVLMAIVIPLARFTSRR